jgi:hypothetical protein
MFLSSSEMNFVARLREGFVKSILLSFCPDIPKSAVFINKISLQFSNKIVPFGFIV